MWNKSNKLIKTGVRWILKPRICYVAAKHELDPSYPAKIDAFKKAFNTLNEVWALSETPKVHIVLQHLGEYLDSAKETLWTCSDENVEACHQFQESKISLMQRTNISKLNFQNLSQWTIMHFYVLTMEYEFTLTLCSCFFSIYSKRYFYPAAELSRNFPGRQQN